MKKAFGFPLIHSKMEFGDIVYGEVYTEDGKRLGCWLSSSIHHLKDDLATHAKDYDYHFVTEMPGFLGALVKKNG